jgi:CRISPR-associated protein Cas1
VHHIKNGGLKAHPTGYAPTIKMIKRVIEISQARTHLSISYGQLVLTQEHVEKARIPCEDIGVILIDHSGVTYTHSVFTELLRHGSAVVICGGDHHPAGMLLPLEGNSVQTERQRAQINAKEPLKKQLWRQLVCAKIRHQAKVAGFTSNAGKGLLELARQVKSGDTTNVEARASRLYWQAYMDSSINFRRNVDGPAPNNMLNYGYMVMRAAVARALCGTGLLASLGLHHCNKYNAFCLADDVMEPLRGFVDARVRDIWLGQRERPDGLDQQTKARLLELLHEEVVIAGQGGPLLVGLHRIAASLERCFTGEQKFIDLPEI